MIFPVPELIAALSQVHTLQEGDIVLTGTPAGVSAVAAGDIITASIVELDVSLEVHVVPRPTE
jgi:acylpyruvate hydrolase